MIGKLSNLVNKYGAKGSARLIARYLRDSILARLGPRGRESARTEALLAEIRAGSYERIILRRGSFGWHTPLFQRAQQLSRALGRRGCLILYEAAPPHDLIRGAQKLGEGLWLVNFRCPRLRRRIESAAAETGRPRYVMIASPESRLPLRVPKRYAAAGWRVIYDYIDAISGEIGGVRRVPKRCRALYEWAMGRGDVIVTASALALRRDAESRGKTAFLVENGVDCAHFFLSRPCPEDESFRALLESKQTIVCFYGALARWLDYEALRRIAADGRFRLLLLGVKYDDSFEKELAGRERVVFLGARAYETLPAYAARCDVLLIPFRKGAVGDAASPVKLFEYMALGKPIVAGDVAECRRCRSALIASAPEDYVPCIERALALRGDGDYLRLERREALAADWLRRARELCAALERIEKERRY